jgi:GT2 family glycosyltransferase
MELSVVIATKGRPEPLRTTLASLAGSDPQPREVVVVDGDPGRSAEPVVEAARAETRAPVRYLASPPGLTMQRNRGLDATASDVVVFLDDDVRVHPRLLAELARAYEDPGVVGATGRVYEEQGRRFGNSRSAARRLLPGGGSEGSMTRYGYPRRLQDLDRARDVEFMQGCLMSARTELARRLRFDESLAGYGLLEDEDFSYRLSRAGRLRYVPEAILHHDNTGGRGSGGREFNRMVVVNRAYLFRKNFRPTPLARAQFAMLLAVLAVHRAINREWAGLRGLAEGSLQAWRERGRQ